MERNRLNIDKTVIQGDMELNVSLPEPVEPIEMKPNVHYIPSRVQETWRNIRFMRRISDTGKK